MEGDTDVSTGHPVPVECEGKILDIDPQTVEKAILRAGGRKLGDRFMRRYVYDIAPGDESRWIRLREDGSEITLTVKQIATDAIGGTHEVETTVDDFDATNTLLGMLGFTAKSYQENRRSSFTLQSAQLEIDSWPQIPPYLEIEAATTAEVVRVASLLGYGQADLTGENTMKVYARHGIDLRMISELTFV